jgi:hypothetical protein
LLQAVQVVAEAHTLHLPVESQAVHVGAEPLDAAGVNQYPGAQAEGVLAAEQAVTPVPVQATQAPPTR